MTAVGYSELGLYENSYTARLTHVSGGTTDLDYLFFDTIVPVKHSTWGAVKSMYRE